LYATPAGTVPLGPVRVKVEAVIVAAFIDVENVAVTGAVVATPAPPLPGDVPVTVGRTGVVAAGGSAVLKDHEYALASAFPLVSLTLVESVAVYVVPCARFADGVSVAVLPLAETVAATGADAPCAVSVKLVLVIVLGSTAAEKVAETDASTAIPVAPAAGVVDCTVGADPTA
jgi:hypothetical protein